MTMSDPAPTRASSKKIFWMGWNLTLGPCPLGWVFGFFLPPLPIPTISPNSCFELTHPSYLVNLFILIYPCFLSLRFLFLKNCSLFIYLILESLFSFLVFFSPCIRFKKIMFFSTFLCFLLLFLVFLLLKTRRALLKLRACRQTFIILVSFFLDLHIFVPWCIVWHP